MRLYVHDRRVQHCGCLGRKAAAAVPHTTVWLCCPGLARNPCADSLTSSTVGPTGATRVQRSSAPRKAPVDCFYVYPTVSGQQTTNANLHIDRAERAVAEAQASRFSTACRVYAPMYPQLTLHAIFAPGGITAAGAATAYIGLLSAFRDYMAHYNHGRGIVFIGHSQGASLLIALLRNEVDNQPSIRRRLVSALLLGGNVTVPVGRRVGRSFAHIPACAKTRETGCVVAYSSFDTTPPPNTLFGRVGAGLNPFAPGAGATRLQVLCVNPASPSGGRAALLPYFVSAGLPTLHSHGKPLRPPSTPWVSYPREYTAGCRSAGGATWLQVDHDSRSVDRRPIVTEITGPQWGLHIYDVNLALGNLVALVRSEASAYRR